MGRLDSAPRRRTVERLPGRTSTMKSHYTFGDNDRAADRLELLARAFEPSTARLLETVREGRPGCAVDLGCGPGHTTELLDGVLGAVRTWGLDASERLVERARARVGPRLSFAVHDVTRAPFPVGEIDVAFSRYVLTHIASPRDVLSACASAVRPGGYFVLEENCALESDDPLFARYYARIEAMQRHYGQDPWLGNRLPSLGAEGPWTVKRFERRRLEVDARVMARLHALNIRTWSRDPFAVSAFDARDIASMTAALDSVAAGAHASAPVLCIMGQAVLQRRPAFE